MENRTFHRIVGIWLFIGVFMILMQVVIGGITRLTGSGLSITKWEIVTGTLPPMNATQWEKEFDLYKATPQYKKINEGMSMKAFKFIYFWEYFHRLWARTMGFVFAIPFFIFLLRDKLDRKLILQLGGVVALAGVVASFGWIMVASGLIDRPWVNAYKLTMHLGLGFSLFAFLWWVTLDYWLGRNLGWFGIQNATLTTAKKSGKSYQPVFHNSVLKRWVVVILAVLVVQILLGGLMSGMKAAVFYPTFPKMGEEWVPSILFDGRNWIGENFINYDQYAFMPALVQTIHRLTAYVLTVIILYFFIRFRKAAIPGLMTFGVYFIFGMLILQFLLGVLTVMNSVGQVPVALGVLHQLGALILLAGVLFIYYPLQKKIPV